MFQKSAYLFKGLYILAWIIYIGLSIEAGSLIVSFIFNVFNPEVVRNLYQKLDLTEMYLRSKWVFFGLFGLILSIAVLKAHLFYVVIRLMRKIDFSKPFSAFGSELITKISYFTLAVGILSLTARQIADHLHHRGFLTKNLNQFWTEGRSFILMAAVIYVIATIFSKGAELQNDNELTI